MSSRRRVPASVPSLRHGSTPVPSAPDGSPAANTSTSPSPAPRRQSGSYEKMLSLGGGVEGSAATRTVPASVPSLFHSSVPPPGRATRKKSRRFTATRPHGSEPPAPGTLSLP